tara:strand:+ start:301 stop:438 length:138 start_codon:yes stop_codon:yes gene_type:complete
MWNIVKVPFMLWLLMIILAALANDICGGCVAKQGNLLTICCGYKK